MVVTPSLGFAQDAPGALASPPDLVKLKNGSMYRGTILELVVDDHVDLRLASGEIKRFSMVDVTSAGPAGGSPSVASQPAPPSVRPLVTVETTAVPIHFESEAQQTTLHIRTGESTVTGVGWGARGAFTYMGTAQHYDPICAAPCDATIGAGTYRLALSYKGRRPVEPEEPVTLSGPSRLQGTYDDREGSRIAGWVIFGLSEAVGATLIFLPIIEDATCGGPALATTGDETPSAPACNFNTGLLLAGAATAVVGAGISLALILQRDHVKIDVTPLTQGLTRSAGLELERMHPGPLPEGLALRARF
jgi:hypothetical protein